MATINYKDKYEKAVQAAMLAKQDTESAVTIRILEEIFPELRESEGERIRKKLIALIEWSKSYAASGITTDEAKEMTDWLEKRGQEPEKVSIWKHWKDGIAGNEGEKLIYLVKGDDTYRLTSCLAFECDYIELSELDSLMFEKQGEQKPADKAEPKFHEGDWVVNNNGEPQFSQVTARSWPDSKIKGAKDNFESFINTATLDKQYHLWTTQDAKDGDVLYSRCCKLLWIYKDEKTCHVGYNLNYNSGSIVINKCVCIPTDVQPATKEQRDKLEKAMADAGYTFDFDKKELKKIEQNPAEDKGMNLVEEEMTPFQKKVFCIIDTSIEEEQGLKQVCEELLALAANEIEQKPDDLKTKAGNWYVCDMEVMNENMVTVFRRGEIYYCPKDGYLDVRGALFEVGCLDVFRLATEKEIPQTKQEWSEEDEKMLKRLCRIVHSQRVEKVITHKEESELGKWMDKWLNHNPQPHWKPSDEQMIALQEAMNIVGILTITGSKINSLYQDLKKLKV